MSVVNCACPKCRQPLQIAQALPARVQCPKCTAVFTISPPGVRSAVAVGPAPARPPVPSAAPPVAPFSPGPAPLPRSDSLINLQRRPQRSGMGIWIWSGVGLVASIALVVGLVVMLGSGTGGSNTPKGATNDDEGGELLGGGGTPGKPVAVQEDARVKAAVDKGVTYLKKRLTDPGGKLLYYFKHNDDPHVGAAALAGMTLVECGVSPKDAAVQKAIQLVKSRKGQLTFTYSVALSILFLDRLCDPDNKDVIKDVPKEDQEEFKNTIRSYALQLVGNQHVTGGWNYYTQLLTVDEEKALLRKLESDSFQAGGFKPPPDDNVYRDNSISQFVILSLWSARRTEKKPHGIPVAEALQLEETIYRQEQNPKDGSWDYNRTNPQARDATTCAGLICLAIGHAVRDEVAEKKAKAGGMKEEKKKLDITIDPSIKKALSFISRPLLRADGLPLDKFVQRQKQTSDLEELQQQFLEKITASPMKELKAAYEQAKLDYAVEKKRNPTSPAAKSLKDRMDIAGDKLYQEAKRVGMLEISEAIKAKDNKELPTGMLFDSDAWGDLYFLWSVERVAVIYGLEKINGKDWFKWGKEIILKNQQSDGSWKERFPGVPDTCFAMLFLKRINIVKDLTDKLRQLMAMLTGRTPPRHAPPGMPMPAPTRQWYA